MDSLDAGRFLRALVAEAIRAPSSHNTQPWRFRIARGAIELWADRTRALPVNDPENRELRVSCGCALANLRCAAAARGLAERLERLAREDAPDLLAVVHLADGSPNTALASLAAYIPARRTHRKAFRPQAIAPEIVASLRAAAEAEGAALHPVADGQDRHALAALVAEGDSVQWNDPRWREELAAWMHPPGRGDGLAVSAWAAPIARAVVRRFDMGRGIARKDRERAERAPLLAVVATREDRPVDHVQAGMALQRVLLEACRHGLQASYLNQPLQVAHLRPRVAALSGGAHPQVILCVGPAAAADGAKPRRPLEEVIAP